MLTALSCADEIPWSVRTYHGELSPVMKLGRRICSGYSLLPVVNSEVEMQTKRSFKICCYDHHRLYILSKIQDVNRLVKQAENVCLLASMLAPFLLFSSYVWTFSIYSLIYPFS